MDHIKFATRNSIPLKNKNKTELILISKLALAKRFTSLHNGVLSECYFFEKLNQSAKIDTRRVKLETMS